ncbi:MAG TPA: hypothetical protein VF756_11745 [Thermoanaerobaculia bacterium]
MPKYQINFSGLIAFVPHTNNKEAMVVLADGSFRHQAPNGEDLFPHYPFILYNLKDLSDDSPRRPELTGQGLGLSFLSYEDLTIGSPDNQRRRDSDLRFFIEPESPPEAQADSGVEAPVIEPVSDAKFQNGAEEEFLDSEALRWIMPIEKIGAIPDKISAEAAKGLRIADECLMTPYTVTSIENKVAARLRLTSGRLVNSSFQRATIAGERLGTVCKFFDEEMKRDDPGRKAHHEQVISTLVTYEPYLDEANKLVIFSKRFSFSEPNGHKTGDFPDLVFRSPRETGRNIVINIWNAPLADILDILGGTDRHQWPRPEGDRSFRSFFRLCAEQPTVLPVLEKSRTMAARLQMVTGPEKNVGCPTCRFPAMPLPELQA